ncbi:MAG: hypothetical protein Q4C52_03160 [Eubacteriales bacterium]|nr:hypothetical protein [Eubacteriales bacterium]
MKEAAEQINCVYCGSELGYKTYWARAVTRNFKVCCPECKQKMEQYVEKDKKYKTLMYLMIFFAGISYLLSYTFGHGLVKNVPGYIAQLICGIAFAVFPYPIISFETFYKIPIRKTVMVCRVVGVLFLISGIFFLIASLL